MREHPPAQIYLASQSPRRRELLAQIGVNYEVLAVAVDEVISADESPDDYATRLALEKARAGWRLVTEDRRLPVLGADTIVVSRGSVLGKPADREQARTMLQSLSGRTHQVITAIAITGDFEAVTVNSSHVTFRTLTAHECDAYWATGEPQDKAGSYAIQGLAAAFISRLEGSYSGVMGLPLFETAELLQQAGIDIL